MKTIGFIANPCSIHDCKWINILAQDYNVLVITPLFKKINSFLNDEIETFEILPEKFPRKNFLKRWRHIYLLKKLIKNKKIDIIHSMYAYPNAFWPELAKFKSHIITTRGSDILVDYVKSKKNASHNVTDKYFLDLFDKAFNNALAITSTSYKQKEVIKSFVLTKSKLSVIRTGINIEDFNLRLNNQTKEVNSGLVLFSPRSMKEIYNIEIIINAFKKIQSQLEKSKLILINDCPNTPYSDIIIEQINCLNLQNTITLLPNQTSSQMIYWYKNSDIIISIPTSDGTPNSVLEAMLAKKEIIIGNYPYDQDLFSNLNQLKENSVECLSNTIVTVSSNINNVENNYTLVTKYANLKQSIKQIKELYDA